MELHTECRQQLQEDSGQISRAFSWTTDSNHVLHMDTSIHVLLYTPSLDIMRAHVHLNSEPITVMHGCMHLVPRPVGWHDVGWCGILKTGGWEQPN